MPRYFDPGDGRPQLNKRKGPVLHKANLQLLANSLRVLFHAPLLMQMVRSWSGLSRFDLSQARS
jgi:hypothetical protein